MPGQIVHFEIPADDTAKGREFWGSLFGWQFESYPGPFEYHMARISDQGAWRSPIWSPASEARVPTSSWTTSTPVPSAWGSSGARRTSRARYRAWAGL